MLSVCIVLLPIGVFKLLTACVNLPWGGLKYNSKQNRVFEQNLYFFKSTGIRNCLECELSTVLRAHGEDVNFYKYKESSVPYLVHKTNY